MEGGWEMGEQKYGAVNLGAEEATVLLVSAIEVTNVNESARRTTATESRSLNRRH